MDPAAHRFTIVHSYAPRRYGCSGKEHTLTIAFASSALAPNVAIFWRYGEERVTLYLSGPAVKWTSPDDFAQQNYIAEADPIRCSIISYITHPLSRIYGHPSCRSHLHRDCRLSSAELLYSIASELAAYIRRTHPPHEQISMNPCQIVSPPHL